MKIFLSVAIATGVITASFMRMMVGTILAAIRFPTMMNGFFFTYHACAICTGTFYFLSVRHAKLPFNIIYETKQCLQNRQQITASPLITQNIFTIINNIYLLF